MYNLYTALALARHHTNLCIDKYCMDMLVDKHLKIYFDSAISLVIITSSHSSYLNNGIERVTVYETTNSKRMEAAHAW